MKVKITRVHAGQSLIDLAIQEYGSIEGMFLIMLANRDLILNLTDDIAPGAALKIWPLKVVKQIVTETESLTPFLPTILQWLAMTGGGGSGSGSGTTGLNDSDYVHVRGDEVVRGIKTFIDAVKTNEIEEIGDGGVSVEGIYMKDGVLDLGTF
jgi:hypothetical protein